MTELGDISNNTYDIVDCLMKQNELLKEQNKALLQQVEQQGEMVKMFRLMADVLRARLP